MSFATLTGLYKGIDNMTFGRGGAPTGGGVGGNTGGRQINPEDYEKANASMSAIMSHMSDGGMHEVYAVDFTTGFSFEPQMFERRALNEAWDVSYPTPMDFEANLNGVPSVGGVQGGKKGNASGGEGLGDKIKGAISFPFEMAAAAYDFGKSYYEMRQAGFIGADKYFHAKANFQATHRGPGGEFFAERFSNLREVLDQNIKGFPRWDSEADQTANWFGREMTKYFNNSDYRRALKIYRPILLPTKY